MLVDYEYDNFTLANTNDAIILTSDSAVLIDQVAYTSADVTNGASMQLDPNTFDHVSNDNLANWSASTTAYGDGDLGTPGALNLDPDFLV